MKFTLSSLLMCLIVATTTLSAQQTPITLGFSQSIQSIELSESRTINIYLPEGYSPDSAKTYPVIYLLDGGVDEDFIHIAGLVQYSSFWWVNRLKPSILVGIANTERKRDFTFKAASDFKLPDFAQPYAAAYANAGGSDKFMNFMEKELIPYIETKYKTNTHRTIIGQSLAGLMATEFLLKRPKLFNDYIIMSPSLWWDNGSLLTHAATDLKALPTTPMHVYIAVGEEGKMMKGYARQLSKVLKQTKLKTLSVNFEFLPLETHGTILHPAVSNAFKIISTK